MALVRYFINERTRLCKVVTGQAEVKEALAEGYREVTPDEQEAFRDITRAALVAGWNPDKINYAKFMANQQGGAK